GWPSGQGVTLGALSAAAADTWASEIGVRSPELPRSILSGHHVAPGTSGGVTRLGWLAAAAGALAIGGVWSLASDRRPTTLVVALMAGLAGSLADSLAGATLQAFYACRVCDEPSEAPGYHCEAPRRLVRGYAWVTNDAVNGIGTATGALVGGLLLRQRD
ncbi:MAG: DUF92 domain-containing protein, partial [Chloroflexota bacterium]